MAELNEEQRLQLLLRLARQVTARHDLEDVLVETFRGLRPMVEFTGGSIQVLDDEGWLRVASSDPPAPDSVLDRRMPLGDSLASRVILTERSIYVPDVRENDQISALRGLVSGPDVLSWLGVPLLADGRAIGLLQADHERVDAFSDRDRLMFGAAAAVIAAAIQSARAYARSNAARTRASVNEQRVAEVRRVVDHVARQSLPAQERLSTLLSGIEHALGDSLNGIDLRERQVR